MDQQVNLFCELKWDCDGGVKKLYLKSINKIN